MTRAKGESRDVCKKKEALEAEKLTDTCGTGDKISFTADEPKKAEAKIDALQPSVLSVGNKETGSSSYVTATQLEEDKPYPGVDYLGMGYDIFKGNPNGEGTYMLDPGFRKPVRVLAYSMNWRTRDGKFRTPMNSVSLPLFSCARSDQYSNIADASSLASSMSIDASLSIEAGSPAGGGSFKASAGYNEAKNEARSSSMYRFESKSYCLKYKFAFLSSSNVPQEQIMPQFLNKAADALVALDGKSPKAMSEQELSDAMVPWFDLFNVYGTHFITELDVGGKVIYDRYVTQSKMREQQSSDWNVGVSGGGKSISFEMQASFSMAMASQSSSESAKEFGGSKMSVMGGVPVGDASTVEGFAAWAKTVDTNPMPVRYKMASFALFSEQVVAAVMTPKEFEEPPSSSGTQAVVKYPCDSKCYTYAQEIFNGQITSLPKLEVKWESRCLWTEPKCTGCLECSSKSPSTPPPPQPPAKPPLLGPPPPPKVTEDLFREAYYYTMEAFGESATQEAKLDPNANVLSLGGGTCVDDISWNNAKAIEYKPTDAAGKEQGAYDGIEWNRYNRDQLERMCHDHCHGKVGVKWRRAQQDELLGRAELGKKCGRLAEMLALRNNAGRVNFDLGEAHDRRALDSCGEIKTLGVTTANRILISAPQCRPRSSEDTCYFRTEKKSPEGGPGCENFQDKCVWSPHAGEAYVPVVEFTPDVVATTFIPPNRNWSRPQPQCKCFNTCPAVKYFKESIDVNSDNFGMATDVVCTDSTSHICALDGHTPWPKTKPAKKPPAPTK